MELALSLLLEVAFLNEIKSALLKESKALLRACQMSLKMAITNHSDSEWTE